MKLSNETIDILSNFANINDSLYFRKGSLLRTVSPLNNIFAEAKIQEKFEMDFGIYSLPMFLSIINTLDTPELEFHENHVTISDGRFSVDYLYASENMITSPPKSNPVIDDTFVSFNITKENWKRFNKTSDVLASPDVLVEVRNGDVSMKAFNSKNSGDNVLNMTVEDAESTADKSARFNSNNLVMMDRDYMVKVSEIAAVFTTADEKLTYVIAAEQD